MGHLILSQCSRAILETPDVSFLDSCLRAWPVRRSKNRETYWDACRLRKDGIGARGAYHPFVIRKIGKLAGNILARDIVLVKFSSYNEISSWPHVSGEECGCSKLLHVCALADALPFDENASDVVPRQRQ